MQPHRWAPGPLRPLLADGVVHVWRAQLTTTGDSRGILRDLLGRYLGIAAHEVPIVAGAHGKPELGSQIVSRRVSFNLSHSGATALYAFASGCAVGVDVEFARAEIDAVALAERAFGPAVSQRLANMDPAERNNEFLRLWVRHEAELKCLGVGLAGAHRRSDSDERRPWVAELDVGALAAAAVAADERPHELCCWDWSLEEDPRPEGARGS